MKLKLQFWKTNKVLVVTVLEQEGLPIKEGEHVSISLSNILRLSNQRIEIGTDSSVIGSMDYLHTIYAKEIIDDIVNAITDEIFSPVQRELKEGDIVTINGSTTYILFKIFPEDYSPRYVLIAYKNKVRLSDTVEPVYPILQRCKLTKDITDTTETYTWEM